MRLKLAVLGAGMIAKRHIEHILAEPEAELTAIIDPSPIGRRIAEEVSLPSTQSKSLLGTTSAAPMAH